MKLYFVRHGESDSNAQEIHQTSDALLSQKGKSQAEFVAKRFLAIPIDTIYSSPFRRAKETANIISKTIKKEIIEDPLLREIKRPTEIEGKKYNDSDIVHIHELIVSHAQDPHWHYSDEENIHDLKNRCMKFIQKLQALHDNNLLIISHGITIRMIIACMMYPEEKVIKNFEYFLPFMHMTNTGITVCERTDEKKFRLLTWNDYAHII